MGYPLRPWVNRGLLLSVREMKTLQRQRPSAFDAESRGLPEAAWVFSWQQMDCSPSSLAKESLREGGARRRLARKMFLPVFSYLEQPSQGYQHYHPGGGSGFFLLGNSRVPIVLCNTYSPGIKCVYSEVYCICRARP
jgi:hypothetical protein